MNETTKQTESEKIAEWITKILFYTIVFGNLITLILFWGNEYDIFGDVIKISSALIVTAQAYMWIAIIVTTFGIIATILMIGYNKLFHENIRKHIKGYDDLINNVVFNMKYYFLGFFLIGPIGSIYNVAGFVILIFYLGGGAWWVTHEYQKVKYIHDRPELLKLLNNRKETKDKLTKLLEAPKGHENEKVTKLYLRLVSLDILINEMKE